MSIVIHFEKLTEKTIAKYCALGRQSYTEHYLHLWEGNDPKSYLNTSFTEEVVTQELKDPNCRNFIVKHDRSNAGILKVSIDKGCVNFTHREALYLHRIYLLNEYSGKGIGKATLNFVTDMATSFRKKIIWLEAMKKGSAHKFYMSNGFEILGDTKVALPGVIEKESEMWLLGKNL